MTFATLINLLVSILCAAVVVQSIRMMRNVQEIKSDNFSETIKSLDQATTQARAVLAELKSVLSTDGAANARSIASGETLRDELSLMVGIGNAVADRIMEAAATVDRQKDEAAKAPRQSAKAGAPKLELVAKPRRKRSTAPKVTAPTHTRLQ